MTDRDIIIEMTSFIYEDGNIYYFNILKRSINFHDLHVYEKVKTTKKN